MKFSQRMGITEVRSAIQTDGMTDELRNSLWNVLDRVVWSAQGFMYVSYGEPDIEPFTKVLWAQYYKRPTDERPDQDDRKLLKIREYFFSAKWYEVYDFVEFCLWLARLQKYRSLPEDLNVILAREMSGYRVIGNELVPVTDSNEVESITEAISKSPFAGARTHFAQALKHLSDRHSPDYRNSIKESISAVESACREVTGNSKATLGDALKQLQRTTGLHGALQAGFSSLYGYTSDEAGIRHAMLHAPTLTQADAKYFLVSCSAFVNYLAQKCGAGT